jgi:hypothetical protein
MFTFLQYLPGASRRVSEHRPHVAEIIGRITQDHLYALGREWDITRFRSVVPMYLFNCDCQGLKDCRSVSGSFIQLYDHLRVELKDFGGQEDYDLLMQIIRHVCTVYWSELKAWEREHESRLEGVQSPLSGFSRASAVLKLNRPAS